MNSKQLSILLGILVILGLLAFGAQALLKKSHSDGFLSILCFQHGFINAEQHLRGVYFPLQKLE